MSNPSVNALQHWIATAAVPVTAAADDSLSAAADALVASLGPEVGLLGFGEALHGGEEILLLRNRLFQRLVEAHGYTAIAIESSFPRARRVDDFVHGRGPATWDELAEVGFGHGMGRLEANRELVEWMREWNRNPSRTPLGFYGFDIPSGTMGVASPRQVLGFAVDFLAAHDPAGAAAHRDRIGEFLGDDAAWENPAVYMDPSKSIALTPSAVALRAETEDLIAALRARAPALAAAAGEDAFREALRHAEMARELLHFHAAMGRRAPGESPATVLGSRDASMADTLAYIVHRERPRGKVFVFAHNSHLQRGEAQWPGQKYWGTDDDCRWWPAGALLAGRFGPRYAVVGSAVGVSEQNGIATPEPGTFENLLAAPGHETSFLPLRGTQIPNLPTRSGSTINPTYTPLNSHAAQNFDTLAFLAKVSYHRGGPPLQTWDAKPPE